MHTRSLLVVVAALIGLGCRSESEPAAPDAAADRERIEAPLSVDQPVWDRARTRDKCAEDPEWSGAEAWGGLRFGMSPDEVRAELAKQGIDPGRLERVKAGRPGFGFGLPDEGHVKASFDPSCYRLEYVHVSGFPSASKTFVEQLEEARRQYYENPPESFYRSLRIWRNRRTRAGIELRQAVGGWNTRQSWQAWRPIDRPLGPSGFAGIPGFGRLTWGQDTIRVREILHLEGLPCPEPRTRHPHPRVRIDNMYGLPPTSWEEFAFEFDGCDWSVIVESDRGLDRIGIDCVKNESREKAEARVQALVQRFGETPFLSETWRHRFRDDFTESVLMTGLDHFKEQRWVNLIVEPRRTTRYRGPPSPPPPIEGDLESRVRGAVKQIWPVKGTFRGTPGWAELESLGRDAYPVLERVLRENPCDLNVGVLEFIADSGDPEALPIVETLFECPVDPPWRWNEQFDRLAEAAAAVYETDQLIDLLSLSDLHVRVLAIEALRLRNDPRALPYLSDLLEGENHRIDTGIWIRNNPPPGRLLFDPRPKTLRELATRAIDEITLSESLRASSSLE